MPKTAPFEQHSDAYDQWFDDHRALYDAEVKAIRLLAPPPGAKGLEVGVGSGKFAVPLGIRTGVEPSEQMANRARQRGVTVYPGVAEALDLPDNSFDFVLMVTTICFVDDLDAAFKEAHRVLRPGGCIVVGFVDKESALGKQYAEKRDQSKFYREATFYAVPEVLEALRRGGFRVDQVKQALIPARPPDIVLDGFGRGAFVVVRGVM